MLKVVCLMVLLVGAWCQELQRVTLDEAMSLDNKGYFKTKSRLVRSSRQRPKEVNVLTNCESYNPCQNGGTCVLYAKACQCPSQFIGKYCEREVLFSCDFEDNLCFENRNFTRIKHYDGISAPHKGKYYALFTRKKFGAMASEKYFNGSMRIDFDYAIQNKMLIFLYIYENGTRKSMFARAQHTGEWKSANVTISKGHKIKVFACFH